MSRTPSSKQQEAEIRKLQEECNAIIRAHLGPKWGTARLTESGNIRTGVPSGPPLPDGSHVTIEEREEMIIGLALKMTDREILKMLNDARLEANKPIIQFRTLLYYRKKYSELIDEVYATAVLRIGDIYRFSDKLYRISRYNELAEVLRDKVMGDMIDEETPSERSIKLANLYLRLLDRVNVEMGGKTLLEGMIKRSGQENEDDGKDINLTKEEVRALVKTEISERYSAQLPKSITDKIDFTDYTICANGEKMGDVVVCWNAKMTNDDLGSQCAIQSGKVQKCPKFLNITLLNNKDWLLNARSRKLTITDIASLAGCQEVDRDCHDRVTFHLKANDVIMRKVADSMIETQLDSPNESNSGEKEATDIREESQ